MKIKGLAGLMALVAALYVAQAGAATKVTKGDMSGSFAFIEDQIDNTYFVTNTGSSALPVMSGANRWVDLSWWDNVRDYAYQLSPGFISTQNMRIYHDGISSMADLWLEDAPVSYALAGITCSYQASTCPPGPGKSPAIVTTDTSVTDAQGVYGLLLPFTGMEYLSGSISDTFFQYLLQMGTGSSFSMTLNECLTDSIADKAYDASTGARCKDQSNATWYATRLTYTKDAHLRLLNTGALDEVFINSDGVPTPGEGNTNCRVQNIGDLSGLACRMVNYSFNGTGGSAIRVYPVLNNAALVSAVKSEDMQFSLDGSAWKQTSLTRNVSSAANYYLLDEMASSSAIYVFFSDNFFKQMVASGLSDTNSQDIMYFRLYNVRASTSSPDADLAYEFYTSNSLEIKPREFSINISSEDYSDAPSREGYVGRDEPSLDFNYIVTTSGKTAADEVLIKATGPTQQINGRAYCIFSADDSSIKVPFPATLSFTKQDGSIKTYDAGCDGSWRDMTDALWLTSAWTDISGEPGVMDKATVKFSIPMNDDISQKTLDNNEWYGDVSASGEIHVQATWRDIN
ncbi:TPA: hypothetical protein OTX98_002599 [Klebsiella aerogenes]|nr:hypothetical protein [Klebsiella aerogenes]